jgi:hypothetical protein
MEIEDETQRLFRASNDHTYAVLWGSEAETGAFHCECSGKSCAEVVSMTLAEYDLLRHRGEFVHARGHELSADERT